MIYYAIVKHLIWGITILTTPFPLQTSTLATLNGLFGANYQIGGMLLILAAIAAVYGAFLSRNPYQTVFFFIPILFFVWLFALTAFNAVIQGHFADGVIRPWQFIFADQLNAVLLGVFLTAVIFEPIWNRGRVNES